MISLELLKHTCEMCAVAQPAALSLLTGPQQVILEAIDDANRLLSSEKDRWFMQEQSSFICHPYASGSEAKTTGAGPYLLDLLDEGPPLLAPFDATLTDNGKATFATGGDDADDVFRIDYASADTATILSDWRAGAIDGDPGDAAWAYGQDEYILPAAVDRVSWMKTAKYSATAMREVFLRPVSLEEMQATRVTRTTYLDKGEPAIYTVVRWDASGSNQLRKVIVDPFPEFASVVHYGYYRVPVNLNTITSTEPDLPTQWHQLLIWAGMEAYFASYGTGAPADSRAGRDVPQILEVLDREFKTLKAEFDNEQRIAGERTALDGSSMERIFYNDALGRNI